MRKLVYMLIQGKCCGVPDHFTASGPSPMASAWKNGLETRFPPLDFSKWYFSGPCYYLYGQSGRAGANISHFLVADTRLYTLPCRSVRPYVRTSVRRSHFWIPSGFCITAPAQPSATGLPCIRHCFHLLARSIRSDWRTGVAGTKKFLISWV